MIYLRITIDQLDTLDNFPQLILPKIEYINKSEYNKFLASPKSTVSTESINESTVDTVLIVVNESPRLGTGIILYE